MVLHPLGSEGRCTWMLRLLELDRIESSTNQYAARPRATSDGGGGDGGDGAAVTLRLRRSDERSSAKMTITRRTVLP